ncbi:hypothetical protein GCM10009117_20650 [Gangjinia marincola]|uniref:Outer membrane protein beta-barrel domain-containing protein n=1 Tax=Gangjinia marincola TaxID=578463 RepID=A0ABN1MI80_9FLAO
MRIVKISIIFLSICVFNRVYGQFSHGELGRFEYNIVPNLGESQLERYHIAINFGKKIKKSLLLMGLDYSYYDIIYNEANVPFKTDPFEQFHIFSTSFTYLRTLSNGWALNLTFAPTLSSNLESKLTKEDIIYNSFLGITKRWHKNLKKSRLLIGLAYGTRFGEPQFFPLINFTKTVNDRIKYYLGIPITGIDYSISQKNKISLKAQPLGFYVNNSEELTVFKQGNFENSKLRLNMINFSVEYNHKFSPMIETISSLGYTMVNTFDVLNTENNIIHDYDPNGSFQFSMGLKINLNKQLNENKKVNK